MSAPSVFTIGDHLAVIRLTSDSYNPPISPVVGVNLIVKKTMQFYNPGPTTGETYSRLSFLSEFSRNSVTSFRSCSDSATV